MRALRYHGTKDLRVEEDISEPECGEYQIKIKPAFCGICGTDLHEYSSPTFIPPKGSPHPVTKESMPITIGHEFSGEIVEIGSKALTNLQVGDKVAVQPTVCCFSCGPCREGYLNCCDSAGFVGLSGGGGGMSDYVCVDAQWVFKLPDHIPLDVGALVEPLAVAWHAVDQYPIKPGDAVEALVLGAGPIGLGVIQCLKARGAKTIIVVELAKERQNFARRFGATHLIDPRTEDVVKRSKDICGGQGPHLALDAAGVPASIKAAALAVRARGTVVNLAIWEKEIPFQPNTLVFGEKKYLAILGYLKSDFAGVIKALGDGSLKPEEMITSKIKIDRVVEDGYRALIEQKDHHVKILVDCRA